MHRAITDFLDFFSLIPTRPPLFSFVRYYTLWLISVQLPLLVLIYFD